MKISEKILENLLFKFTSYFPDEYSILSKLIVQFSRELCTITKLLLLTALLLRIN